MSQILTQCSTQWASRPSDQRFLSLTELHTFVKSVRERSAAKCISSRTVHTAPLEGANNKALVCVGPNGTPVDFTHWSFGQLAARAGAPAGYMRDLPAVLAAECINYGLQTRDIEDLGILLTAYSDRPAELRAVTGPNYGRVWNETIVKALISRFGDGVTGAFRVPGEFGKRVAVTKDNTTIYASDRDLFVFLADEEHRVEIPNRRDGETGSLARGFFVWNSEVGSLKYGVATFLFDYCCCNRIVWGVEGFEEISGRHTVSAPERWLAEIEPAIHSYANSSTSGVKKAIEDARAKRIDDVDQFLLKRFTRSQTVAIKAAHMADEQRPIETLWDASVGVTAYARGITYQDDRVALEREGGKILKLAA